MNIRSAIFTFLAICWIAPVSAQNTKPTPKGMYLSDTDVKNMQSKSQEGNRLVMIEGYAAFCGSAAPLRKSTSMKMEIRTQPDCKGEKLFDADVQLNTSGDLSAIKMRNTVLTGKDFNNKRLVFITDEYQAVSSGKLQFSGILRYVNKSYLLEIISIYKSTGH